MEREEKEEERVGRKHVEEYWEKREKGRDR